MRLNESEKLEQLARQIVRADVLSSDETEKIIAAPRLLAAIRARIEAEKSLAPAAAETTRVSWLSGFFENINGLINQKHARPVLLGGAFALILAGMFWYFGAAASFDQNQSAQNQLSPQLEPSLEKNEPQPNLEINIKRESPPRLAKSTADELITPPQNQTVSRRDKIVRQVKKIELTRQLKSVANGSRHQKSVVAPRQFYQLAYASDLEDNENKQIVRVKLSPTALARLGVTAAAAPPPIPASRNEDFYTADLLLGEDGSPRAIRFVK